MTHDKGSHTTLGAHIDENGAHFSVYSENAEQIELCLFDDSGLTELKRIPLQKGENHIWSTHVTDITAGQVYGYRAHGIHDPQNGKLFNADLILVDPYARDVFETYSDEGEQIIRGRITKTDDYDWQNDERPNIPMEDTIFYEAHVKGFTQENTAIDKAKRGTFAALSDPDSIAHLKDLGITSIELLPVHSFLHENRLQKLDKSNYWGYNTLSFFAPHADYMASGSADEFKDAIKALHKAGIEVILDVVYNHTAESDADGPILSMKGLDNETYYRLRPDNKEEYVNETGCGNTTNITHPVVTNLVIDSLRYWADEFHIDGFRFDLASSLARDPEFFSHNSPFLRAIENDPVLSKLKLMAEPWDIGPDGYKLGAFPQGWAEWNDRYRDSVRHYWRGDAGSVNNFTKRITGSADIFEHSGRKPSASINFLSVHDGFTLHDVVSYNDKHNEANGEDNRDGHSHNISSNYGEEGPTTHQHIQTIREQQKRNMLATLFLSKGTPLLLAGDEFGNTQNGNNNAYCQDNEIGWLNWEDINDDDLALQDFVSKMIEFRKEHPVLTHADYLHGHNIDTYGVPGIQWYDEHGIKKDWSNPHKLCFAALFNNAAIPDDQNPSQSNERLLIIFNSSATTVKFELPELAGSHSWTKKIDTAAAQDHFKQSEYKAKDIYEMAPHSISVFTHKMR